MGRGCSGEERGLTACPRLPHERSRRDQRSQGTCKGRGAPFKLPGVRETQAPTWVRSQGGGRSQGQSKPGFV